MQRGQTIQLVTSCVVTQAELGQLQEKFKEDTQSVTRRINDTETRIGGASVENMEKAGRKADSVQSIVNRQCYETKEEKRKFILESFKLDTNGNIERRCQVKGGSD